MRFECRIERRNNPVGEPVFPKLHEGVEVMSERSQVAALFSGKTHDDLRTSAFDRGGIAPFSRIVDVRQARGTGVSATFRAFADS